MKALSRLFDLKRPCALGVATLLLALNVVVVVLDSRDLAQVPAVESEHQASCQLHDHTICVQVSSNRPFTGTGPSHGAASQSRSEPNLREQHQEPALAAFAGPSSRAPPLG